MVLKYQATKTNVSEQAARTTILENTKDDLLALPRTQIIFLEIYFSVDYSTYPQSIINIPNLTSMWPWLLRQNIINIFIITGDIDENF